MVELDCLNLINENIKEYFQYFDMSNSLQIFLKEIKGKIISKRLQEI